MREAAREGDIWGEQLMRGSYSAEVNVKMEETVDNNRIECHEASPTATLRTDLGINIAQHSLKRINR